MASMCAFGRSLHVDRGLSRLRDLVGIGGLSLDILLHRHQMDVQNHSIQASKCRNHGLDDLIPPHFDFPKHSYCADVQSREASACPHIAPEFFKYLSPREQVPLHPELLRLCRRKKKKSSH